ncbi:class I SAM-dependent methyltransferase [Halodesulfovibrio sp. MK-HDV]|jgi:putative rRNA methylase|uniref:tRNA (mnm(5)s(2)U34)-methyltransferase n=1 Tax=unclassified Halodesulfovibrio TaxID=2644657 RepID=UPI00137113BF|nr:class I SAM-dependent methyltransferase [Halodesulfovibrio sp. MK-HDV]KAF1076707.1 Ribosomal RNA small subunit methyltransferase H [Halodesulfovibrio sp. MK-HDV]
MRPRHIPSILQFTKSIWQPVAASWCDEGIEAIVVDGTVGNGHDTMFLADLIGENGHVYGFDVQKPGLENTRERLEQKGLGERATLFHAGHETVGEHLPEGIVVAGAMYNLGYLPGSDHAVITRADTTITSLQQLLPLLMKNGIVTVHIYTGHEGGVVEGDKIQAWSTTLPWNQFRVAQYDFPNKKVNKEHLLVIEKF